MMRMVRMRDGENYADGNYDVIRIRCCQVRLGQF
jgi:hypothetical protein